MRSRPVQSFILVIILTLVGILINFSAPIDLQIQSFKTQIPSINLKPLIGIDLNERFPLRRGLDLEGGTSITLKADMKDVPPDQRDSALESAREVVERRVNFFGVSEPVIQTAKVNDDYRIIAEIPGITDVNQAVKLIGQTAKLSFWEPGEELPATESARIATDAAELVRIASSSGKPLGVVQILGPNAKITNLTGADLKQSTVPFDPNTGKPQVGLEFTAEGSRKFADITKRNIGKVILIALDDRVIEAPRVNQAIFGDAVITGEFTPESAKTLQVQLNAGALPVSLSILEQRATGATLGNESVQKSLIAGIIGFVVIVIFMVSLYGRLGVIASAALLVYTLLVLTLFRIIPITLTLAGIAGFILSIGVAVDANILIFERMKEEIRSGRSQDSAIDLGFTKAWPSIKDSNVSSLITSGILYYFGTPVVKGFAFTLAVGVMASMFSAIFVTRTLLHVFIRGEKHN